MGGVKLTALSCALSKTEAFSDILPVDLEPMQVKGLCHAHVRIVSEGVNPADTARKFVGTFPGRKPRLSANVIRTSVSRRTHSGVAWHNSSTR